jgi:hypothetical protein
MEPVPCLGCSDYFIPRNANQSYCSKSECQKKRKADWQKKKVQTDPLYRETQKLSHKKWLIDNPDYWKNYRRQNPLKAQRNRTLQYVRNKRSRQKAPPSLCHAIAKMDARKSLSNVAGGEFWLVPVIAKMDVAKIYFRLISAD